MAIKINLTGRVEIAHDLTGLAGDAFDSFERVYKTATSGQMDESKAQKLIQDSWAQYMESPEVMADPKAFAYKKNLADQIFRGRESYQEFKKTIDQEVGDVGTLTRNAANAMAILIMAPVIFPRLIKLAHVRKMADAEAEEKKGMFRRVNLSALRLHVATKMARKSSDRVMQFRADLDAAIKSGDGKMIERAARDLRDGLIVYKDDVQKLSRKMEMTLESLEETRKKGVYASVSSNVFRAIGGTRSAAIDQMASKFNDAFLSGIPKNIADEIRSLTSKEDGEVTKSLRKIGNLRGALSSKAFIDLSRGFSRDIADKMGRLKSGDASVLATKSSLSLFVEQMNDAMNSKLPVSGGIFGRDQTQAILSDSEVASMNDSYEKLNKVQRALCSEANRTLIDSAVFYASPDKTNTLSNYNASIARALGRGEEEFLDCLKTLSSPGASDSDRVYAKETLLSLAKVNAVDFGKFDVNGVYVKSEEKIGSKSGAEKRNAERMISMFDALKSADPAVMQSIGEMFSVDASDEGKQEEANKVKEKLSKILGELFEKIMPVGPSAPSV